MRDKIVVSTKYSFNTQSGNPNGGGNGRKNLYRSVENSLKRLKTDYIDMYWMDVWDMVTPVEEVLQSMENLVIQGKIRYFCFSDMPAWYAAKASAITKAYNTPSPIAQQLYYALTDRTIEQEHIPAALDAGQGILPWSTLAYGFLTGKYKKSEKGEISNGDGRLDEYNPMFPEVTEQHWKILEVLRKIADNTEYSMAQLALAWVVQKKGVSSTLLGVSNLEQLKSNIASLDILSDKEHLEQLEEVSKVNTFFPYGMFKPEVMNNAVFGDKNVSGFNQ